MTNRSRGRFNHSVSGDLIDLNPRLSKPANAPHDRASSSMRPGEWLGSRSTPKQWIQCSCAGVLAPAKPGLLGGLDVVRPIDIEHRGRTTLADGRRSSTSHLR